jgi:hypothetical protein
VPTVPLNLANDPSITNTDTFGLTWEPSADDGGTTDGYIDYRLWYALETEPYVNYIDGITTENYNTNFITDDG